jgi:hypothetical protein
MRMSILTLLTLEKCKFRLSSFLLYFKGLSLLVKPQWDQDPNQDRFAGKTPASIGFYMIASSVFYL